MNLPTRLTDYILVIPKELKRPVEWRSWLALIRCLGVITLLQAIIFFLPDLNSNNLFWNLPMHLISIFFAGLSLVGLFVLCHDCGHYSFSRHGWVNDVVGFLCFIPLLNSFFAWRWGHNYHHQNTQIRRFDPDWPELLSTADEYKNLPWYEKLAIRLGPGSFVGILVGFWVGMLKRSFFTLFIPKMKMPLKKVLSLYALNIISAICTIAFVQVYLSFLGTEKFVVMYVIPVLIAASTGAFLTFIQHSHPGSYVFDKSGFDPVLSHVQSTYNIRFSRLFEFFWLDINVHTPHHILPGIPWYNLRPANEALKAQFRDAINERNFSFKALIQSWNSTTLVKVKEGVYKIQ